MKAMRKINYTLILAFALVSQLLLASSGDSVVVLKPAPKHMKESYIITHMLSRNHYRKVELNDSLSSIIFHSYLKALDNNKAYFTNSDVEYFKKYEFELDDDIKRGNVDVAFQIFRMFRNRANTRIDYVFELIDGGFDYSKNESMSLETDDLSWSKSEAEIQDRWRKIIKSQALSLKLSGKDEDGIKEALNNRYKRYKKGINQYNSDDVFQFFMNSYTETYDPHTNYFSPVAAENFMMRINLSLEGIGARLTQSMDYTVVNEVIPGGPAYKSKDIYKDDRIVAVAQGDEEEFVDVVGWRLQDVVQLIRGPKGSVVRMQILRANAAAGSPYDEIRLVRDKIKLEDESAKAEVIPIREGNKVYNLGVITVPSFYMDFEDARKGVKDFKSTTRDVKNLLTELKEQNVDGVMIDLRFNGGGILQEAIDLTGLFIDQGPVVQVKNTDGSVDVKDDLNTGVVYDGPLAVMINRFSASASEIFSGAIQDYNRGIVIGETTFGKGTVQRPVSLNQMFPNDEDKMGQLKLTLAKFYRVTGSSTQHMGVTPDIAFPSAFSAAEFGESSQPNALPWDQISTSTFNPTNTISDEMRRNLELLYQEHLKTDPDMQKMVEDIARIKSNRDKESISLNYEVRKAEQDKEANKSNNDELSESAGNFNKEFSVDPDNIEKIQDDPYLKEGLRLLANLVNERVG